MALERASMITCGWSYRLLLATSRAASPATRSRPHRCFRRAAAMRRRSHGAREVGRQVGLVSQEMQEE